MAFWGTFAVGALRKYAGGIFLASDLGSYAAVASAVFTQRDRAKVTRAGARNILLHRPEDQSVYHTGGGAEYDHRSGHGEHLHRRACDHALCLCQDRDEGNFCPILLGFWLLKFLKKSAFFAKLL